MTTTATGISDSVDPARLEEFVGRFTGDLGVSRSQEIDAGLGAQAGEARVREVLTAAGFTHFRRVAETPFNLVFEARP